MKKKTMTKKDLITEIRIKTGLRTEDISKMLEAQNEVVKSAVSEGAEVVLRGFGTFFTKVKAQKVGKDFKNGGSIVIPEHKVVSFKASKDFKL